MTVLISLLILCALLFCFFFYHVFENESNDYILKYVALGANLIINLLYGVKIGTCFSSIISIGNIYKQEIVLNYLNLSMDALSCWFIFLTSLLVSISIITIWNNINFKKVVFLLIILEQFLIVTLSCTDLLVFYIFFESVVIPMYFLIGMEGSRERKVRAVYLFFFYTLGGSILMFVGILYIYKIVGSLNFYQITSYNFTELEQHLLWIAFFLSFASKIPMFPFHIWLPEAHVEAPTVGSVLLAGILLKLGVYGLVRVNLLMFPLASCYYTPFVHLLGILGVIYASLTAIRQTDMKRIIAYSSVAHMSMVAIGLFSFNVMGIEGSIIQSISHGFVASALFLLVGVLYDRYHSRSIQYYGGFVMVMPLFAIFFLIFTMCNIALPGTSSFIGEFLILSGIYKINVFVAILCSINVIICGIYSLWYFNRVMYCNLKDLTVFYEDLKLREFCYLFPLLILSLLIGIYPYLLTVTLKILTNDICSFMV